MQGVGLIALVVSTILSGVVGTRLWLAGLRADSNPQIIYGLALILSAMGTVGRVVIFGAFEADARYHMFVVLSLITVLAAVGTLAYGFRITFRRDSALGWALQLGITGLGAVGTFYIAIDPMHATASGIMRQFPDIAGGLAVTWGALEAFSYHGKLRRRLTFGLTDAMTCHRFLLWGVALSFNSVNAILVIAVPRATGMDVLDSTAATSWLAFAMVSGAIVLYTAFYPAVFYERWVLNHAASVEPVA